MGWYLVMLAVLLVGGVLMVRDGLYLMRQLTLADELVHLGMQAEDACRLAGCSFWDQPWYRRMAGSYPSDRLPDEFRILRR
ncbi:hypothetical protein [Pseudoduganella lutea]|uniref:Uncharacterized protein n=1 Tax=Pseudoduganella lutea TaxID=321985 RepID=A0A4P6KTY6_9BURK|nr:hypothetical protein [Pseudoduganella lutea]QBE62154.1 hypothetical protein EWM63_03435 [Pseudoduganella lutea]